MQAEVNVWNSRSLFQWAILNPFHCTVPGVGKLFAIWGVLILMYSAPSAPLPTPFPLAKCPEPHLNCYLLLFSKLPNRLWAHPASFGIDTGLLSPGYSGRGVKLITYLYLLQKLRINGAIPLLNLYAFLARTGKT
jgi:hypothetical protein